MRIDEVVLDRERLFKMKQQYDLRKKKKKLDTMIQQAQDEQAKLESWMNTRLNVIEHMPDRMFQLELLPVTRNFMGGVSPIEVLFWALADKGTDTFTPEQYKIAKKVATKYRSKIIEMLSKQLAELNELAKEADQQGWAVPWRETVTKFEALHELLEDLLRFFSRTKSSK